MAIVQICDNLRLIEHPFPTTGLTATVKVDIHPSYQTIKATCRCGAEFEIGTTLKEDIQLEVCSNCHPFYTGTQKILDSGGRVERFQRQFGGRRAASST